MIPLNLFGPGFLARLTFGNDGTAKAGAKVFRQRIKLGVAINLDGLFGGIANYVAVVAPGQVIFELRLGTRINYPVQIIGELLQKFRTFHCLPSPLSRF